ncbi:hypothetical protein RYX36_012847, partial [Vicia faba]
IFTLNPRGAYRYFMEDMEKRKWGVLLTPPTELNFNIIREFYANPVHFKRRDMNTKAQLYATLLLYNIKPRSHTSTIPIDTTFLLYYTIKGCKIDVAQNISNEIQKIAISGHSHGNKIAMTLGFPTLITGLCRQVGVDITYVTTKRISSVLNEDYVHRHCVSKLTREAAPQPHARSPLTGPVRYNKQQAYVYNRLMMEAQMRASFFIHNYMQ